ncbi:MAG TPA: hypothetical protein VF768_00825 [Holophagaceae bacterium]
MPYCVPMADVHPWQRVPWHLRRSYWELEASRQRALREALEAEAAERARRVDAALDDYAGLPDSLGGRLLNADLLATLLPSLRANPTQGYEALEDPNGRAAVHLHALGKRLRDRILAQAQGHPVLILMGGQATSKTTGAAALGWSFGAVFDAPHTDPDGLAFLTGRIRSTGSEIHLAYADRSPAGAVRAMLERSEREGRYVPLDRMARAHARAPRTFLAQEAEDLRRYYIRVDEGTSGSLAVDREAVDQVRARPELPESAVAYQLQTAYLALLRNPIHDPDTWYPRDVLAGLNRSIDPWRRLEADHLLRRRVAAMAQRSAEGAPGPRGAAPPGAGEPGAGLG